MSSGKESASKQGIPLEEIQHCRGAAQEQSMNTILSAQQRYEHAKADSARDSVYDAIADAKKQIHEEEKILLGEKIEDQHKQDTVVDGRDCVYDAIADAKKQIHEKEKIPLGEKNEDQQEYDTEVDARSGKQEEGSESARKGIFTSLGEKFSGYAKNVKDVVASGDITNSAKSDSSK